MPQAFAGLYFLTVLTGSAVLLCRSVQRNLPLIGAALAYRPRDARCRTRLPQAVHAR